MTVGQAGAETVLDGEGLAAMVVVPYSGEALVLAEMTAAQLGEAIDDARLFEQSRLCAFKRELQDEVLRRMDGAAAGGKQGAWTIRDGDWKLTGDSPDRSDYNVEELPCGHSPTRG
ncbi:MAG: hypothetical protein ABSG43_11045 [Solirubrobacteraceae bacterium]